MVITPDAAADKIYPLNVGQFADARFESLLPCHNSANLAYLRGDFCLLVLIFRCREMRFKGNGMLYLPNYASALRCIGQALQSRNVDIFELIADTDKFVVQCGDPNPPYTDVLKLQYSLDSITILDREGQAKRRQTKAEFRFDSLPEILRATGKYVDSKRAQLRQLNTCCSSAGEIELEYQTKAGEIQSETLVMGLIRETAVDMYKRRSRISNPIDILTRRN